MSARLIWGEAPHQFSSMPVLMEWLCYCGAEVSVRWTASCSLLDTDEPIEANDADGNSWQVECHHGHVLLVCHELDEFGCSDTYEPLHDLPDRGVAGRRRRRHRVAGLRRRAGPQASGVVTALIGLPGASPTSEGGEGQPAPATTASLIRPAFQGGLHPATSRRCAWPSCQAGGVILPRARYVTLDAWDYHPGCAEAARRAA